MKARVSMAIMALSDERAEFVRQLNKNKVETTAWLLVDIKRGYWSNMNNADAFTDFYHEFRAWTVKNNLTWATVGLDLEIDLSEIIGIGEGRLDTYLLNLRNRYYNGAQLAHAAEEKYAQLVKTIRSHGYEVESYVFPFLQDERALGNTFFRTMFALIDLKTVVDREIPMLYGSGLPMGKGFLKSYGKLGKPVALGSTGYDPMDSPVPAPYESWQDFEHDLIYTFRYITVDIYVYSLQGTVKNGYLEKIAAMDWTKPLDPKIMAIYDSESKLVTMARYIVRSILYLWSIISK